MELVTEPVTGITEHGVIAADGTEYPADVIVYGTGFHVTDAFEHADITGANGRRSPIPGATVPRPTWAWPWPGSRTCSCCSARTPGLGHNSMIFMIESQVHYVLQVPGPDRHGRARSPSATRRSASSTPTCSAG